MRQEKTLQHLIKEILDMRTSHKFAHTLMALFALIVLASAAFAQTVGPGQDLDEDSEVSDQKPGSILFYNIYTSSAASANAQNTTLSITNTNPVEDVFVHLFFVDGATCTPADAFVCLTRNQTASFLASDIDPGVTGYLMAVAVDGDGTPAFFNWLIGSEFVKFSSGHHAGLGAEAIAALDDDSFEEVEDGTIDIEFDGEAYNRLPRVLALDRIPSPADGNNTMIIINRVGGNLLTGADSIGPIFGIAYDDAEKPLSFTFNAPNCQFISSLNNNFPRLTPRLETFIPAGRTGWMKFYSLNEEVGLLGSVLNFNPMSSMSANAFDGGYNLHKLTVDEEAEITIPVFPPGC
jgi:hypothetical protein